MNKTGDMTVTKLVSIILGAVILILVIAGTITGGLKPLEEKISSQFDKIQLLFTKDKPTTGDCEIYSDNCPGGCRKINEENVKGDFSLCLDACYLKTISTSGGNNITYKYSFIDKTLELKMNEEPWESRTDYASDEGIRTKEIYDDLMHHKPNEPENDRFLRKGEYDGETYAIERTGVFGAYYPLYIKDGFRWTEIYYPFLDEREGTGELDYFGELRLFFEEECK